MADNVDELLTVRKTFSRISRKTKAKMKARKLANETNVESTKMDAEFLKCPECKSYFEDPVCLQCGHLLCKMKCGAKIMKDTCLECPACKVISVAEKGKGIDSLESVSVFNIVLAKLKSGIDPKLIPEFRTLQEEIKNEDFSLNRRESESGKIFLPRQLEDLKNIIQHGQLRKCDTVKPKTKSYVGRGKEVYKEIMKSRAAKLIALPKDEREKQMDLWKSNGTKFPSPPSPGVMEELHEKCKAQAEAFRLTKESPAVPSLFDITVPRPNKSNYGAQAITDGPFGREQNQEGWRRKSCEDSGSLLKPAYIYGRQNKNWGVETEPTTEDEQWVDNAQFGEVDAEMNDFYYAVSDVEKQNTRDFHGRYQETVDRPLHLPNQPIRHTRPPRPNLPEQLPGNYRPPNRMPQADGPPRIPSLMGPRAGTPPNHRVPSLLSLDAGIQPRPPRPRHPFPSHQMGKITNPNLPYGQHNPANRPSISRGPSFEQQQVYERSVRDRQHEERGQYEYQHPQYQHPGHPGQSPHVPQQPYSQQQHPQAPPNYNPQVHNEQPEAYRTQQINQQHPQSTYGPHHFTNHAQIPYDQGHGEKPALQDQNYQFSPPQEPYDPTQPYFHGNANTYQYEQSLQCNNELPTSQFQQQPFAETTTQATAHPEAVMTPNLETQQHWNQALLSLKHGVLDTEFVDSEVTNSMETMVSTDEQVKFLQTERPILKRSGPVDTGNEGLCTEEDSTAEPAAKVAKTDDEFETPVTTTPHLCVGHLPAGVKPSEIRTLLRKFGEVVTCKLASNNSGTKLTHFAMVTMDTVDAASKCIRALHESQFKGVKIIVKKMKNNPAVRR